MKIKHWLALGTVVAAVMSCASVLRADTLELNDGAVISNCFVQDEAIRFNVWEKMSDVGTPKQIMAGPASAGPAQYPGRRCPTK